MAMQLLLLSACEPANSSVSASPVAQSSTASVVAHESESETAGSGDAPGAPPETELVAQRRAPNVPIEPLPLQAAWTDVELATAHPDARNAGASCNDDRQCDSPLRCVNSVCAWPAAMTGSFDTASTAVVFYPSGQDDRMYSLERAQAPHEQQRGLMHRRTMVENGGMIFINNDEQIRRFWMRNTVLPLDIIFLDSLGRVVSFRENCPPFSDDLQPSTGPARYIIELRAGQVAEMGLRPGDRAELLNMPAP